MTLSPHRPTPALARYAGYRTEHPLAVFGGAQERPMALVLLLHGGGFVSGSPDSLAPMAERLAERLASLVVVPAYTLATAAPFPAAAEDAYAALCWAHAQAPRSVSRPVQLVLTGIEAGGNLAAAAAMMARDRGGPLVAAQVLVRPMLDPSQSTRSMRCGGADETQRCRAAYRAYLSSGSDQLHPYGAPLASQRLGGLPPALIFTAEHDALRDEAESYAANLIRAGVTTQVVRLDEASPGAVCAAAALDAIAGFVGPRLARPSSPLDSKRNLP